VFVGHNYLVTVRKDPCSTLLRHRAVGCHIGAAKEGVGYLLYICWTNRRRLLRRADGSRETEDLEDRHLRRGRLASARTENRTPSQLEEGTSPFPRQLIPLRERPGRDAAEAREVVTGAA